jgi:NADH:ubiquinone oxidoreductase subunit 6 (subunit J)
MNILGYILIAVVVFITVLIILRRPKLNADTKRFLERYKYAILFFVVIAALWILSGAVLMINRGPSIPISPIPLNMTTNATMMP